MPIIDTRFRLRSDTAANWASVNPVPLDGEPCIETDTGLRKCGDGTTHYNDLLYIISGDFEGLESIADGQVPVWDAANGRWKSGEGGAEYTAGDGIEIDSDNVISSTLGSIAVDGRVSTYGDLPATPPSGETTYYVEADGLIYIWDGSAWPAEGDGIQNGGGSEFPTDTHMDKVVALANFDAQRPIIASDLAHGHLVQRSIIATNICTVDSDGLLVSANGGLYTNGDLFPQYDIPVGIEGTVDVWVRPSTTQVGTILSNRSDLNGGWLIRQELGGKIIVADIGGASATTASAVLSAGTWAFLRLRFTTTKCELWVDGTKTVEFTRTSYTSSGRPLFVGYYDRTGVADDFSGSIASYRITQGFARDGIEVPSGHFF